VTEDNWLSAAQRIEDIFFRRNIDGLSKKSSFHQPCQIVNFGLFRDQKPNLKTFLPILGIFQLSELKFWKQTHF
jgi:hypothetical protein